VNKPTELEDHRSILFYFLISKQRSFIKKNVGAPEYTGSIQKDANRKGKTYEKHEKKKKKKKNHKDPTTKEKKNKKKHPQRPNHNRNPKAPQQKPKNPLQHYIKNISFYQDGIRT
jgi:hypothetical protein